MRSNSTRKWNYVGLAFVGLLLIVLPLFADLLGVSAGQVGDYVKGQRQSRIWWEVTGIPVLGGIAFLVAAICAPILLRRTSTDIALLVVAVLLSAAMAFFVKGVAIVALVLSLLLLIAELLAVGKPRG
jgi:hypothetical protein